MALSTIFCQSSKALRWAAAASCLQLELAANLFDLSAEQHHTSLQKRHREKKAERAQKFWRT
eukprot:scaffold8131_cov215-Skeletonema_dohrnii-CCMP3373.AAC.3